MSEAKRPNRRNQHCMNCGDTRGGPIGHETSECTYGRTATNPDLATAVARYNAKLSAEDRAAILAHAARILENQRRIDQLAEAIGIKKST
jgi:hypothetical protein